MHVVPDVIRDAVFLALLLHELVRGHDLVVDAIAGQTSLGLLFVPESDNISHNHSLE
jgi:hypothetical protein